LLVQDLAVVDHVVVLDLELLAVLDLVQVDLHSVDLLAIDMDHTVVIDMEHLFEEQHIGQFIE